MIQPPTTSATPWLSVVVPTYREAENLDELVSRVSATLDQLDALYEILIVDDDSRDGTVEVVRRLAAQGRPVRLIVRHGERGLGSAVLRGFHEARGDRLVCMDADLSHPPEVLPELLRALDDEETELAVGSRYVSGGSTDPRWSWYRRWNSRVATWLARPFTSLRDPLAGFFALPRSVFLRAAACDPVGYKIGLELLVKANCRRVREVPIQFVDRRRGDSKLDWRQQLAYVQHLSRLADFRFASRWRLVKYCLVGLCGAGIDLAVFDLLLQSSIDMPVARAVGIVTGMSCNFIGNDRFTFGTRHLPGACGRFVRFVLACGVGNLISFATALWLPWLAPPLADHPLVCAIGGILAGTLFNFTASHSWAFRHTAAQQGSTSHDAGRLAGWLRRTVAGRFAARSDP